jgi:hypothetical protein
MDTIPTTLKQMLTKHFAPAGDQDDQRMMKSTNDLFRILDEHAPGKFKPEELYDELVSGGFQDKLIGDGLLWAVKPAAIRS